MSDIDVNIDLLAGVNVDEDFSLFGLNTDDNFNAIEGYLLKLYFIHSFIHIRLFSVVKTQPNMN